DSTQDQIFDETKRLVQSAIDGYNVCIFAYGQTGSGKTFTIQGTQDLPGLTPRAIGELFGIVGKRPDRHVQLRGSVDPRTHRRRAAASRQVRRER
ncbi:MAG: hypothetical protein GWP75_02490, partial [Planctomycetia bacterium]|nr:hypothetical protein [Planctomycetia bacterium]